MIYLQRLLRDTNNKCIATNMLAKLIFQDQADQKLELFQNQQLISGLLQAWHFFILQDR